MSRNLIGALLFRAKRSGQFFIEYLGQTYSVQELLEMLQSREVTYEEAIEFVHP